MTAPDIFLSYNREDAATAKLYADAFAGAGLEVWWDVTLRSGEAYDEVTEEALRGAKAVVVLWSPNRSKRRSWRARTSTSGRRKCCAALYRDDRTCRGPIPSQVIPQALRTR